MQLKTEFDDEWKYWIWSNVNNGCHKKGIFEILLRNGFHFDSIKRELGYDPAAPLTVHNSVSRKLNDTKGVRKVDTDKLELYELDNFLDHVECEKLIELSTKNFHASTLSSVEKDKYFRTSFTCSFNSIDASFEDSKFIQMIDARICNALEIPPSYSEPIQAQRYRVGQEFKAHTDYFSANEYEQHCKIQGNRTWTFMIYLNAVEEGGETHMCSIDTKFHPKAGRALTWNNLKRDGHGNHNTLHAGRPVLRGSKYIITKWFRQNAK